VRLQKCRAIALAGVRVLGILPLSTAIAAETGARGPAITLSPHGRLNLPCRNCHTVSGWKVIRAVPEFDHGKTGFPLQGLHLSVSCTQCHTKLVFANTGTGCADCHADVHRRQMGSNCARCHSVTGWQVTLRAVGNHENRFPLTPRRWSTKESHL